MIKEIESIINAEEQEDNAMRQQYGPKWTRTPSAQLNGNHKSVVQQS